MGFIFLLGSLVLVVISRSALRVPGSHGFYRFFAWEAILGLVILQAPYWFDNPTGGRQVISWILLILSVVLVVEGVRLLKQFGQPESGREAEGLVGIEKTTRLVTTGLYRYIRHPLYSSLICLAWGAVLKDFSAGSVLLAGTATGLLILTARIEEKENARYFGDRYRVYIDKTKMFIPFIF